MIAHDNILSRSNLTVSQHGRKQFSAAEQKLKNVIRAYGNSDLLLNCCVGYNYIVSLLLCFVKDEEMTFWCLHAIMQGMNWRRYFMQSDDSSAKL